MKKKIIIIILIMGLLTTIGIITYSIIPKDNKQFKEEYENYNKKGYVKLEIEKENPIKYLTNENIISEISKEDKLLLLAAPNNNESRIAIKEILKVAKDNGIKEINYYNPNKIIKEKNKLYNELTKFLKEEPKIPSLILIKKGKVSTISKELNITEKKLTKKQEKEIYTNYEDVIIEYIMCTTDC